MQRQRAGFAISCPSLAFTLHQGQRALEGQPPERKKLVARQNGRLKSSHRSYCLELENNRNSTEYLGGRNIIRINSEYKLDTISQTTAFSLGLNLTPREPIQIKIGQGVVRGRTLRELSGGTLPFSNSDSAD
jgi:hypothetical protein